MRFAGDITFDASLDNSRPYVLSFGFIDQHNKMFFPAGQEKFFSSHEPALTFLLQEAYKKPWQVMIGKMMIKKSSAQGSYVPIVIGVTNHLGDYMGALVLQLPLSILRHKITTLVKRFNAYREHDDAMRVFFISTSENIAGSHDFYQSADWQSFASSLPRDVHSGYLDAPWYHNHYVYSFYHVMHHPYVLVFGVPEYGVLFSFTEKFTGFLVWWGVAFFLFLCVFWVWYRCYLLPLKNFADFFREIKEGKSARVITEHYRGNILHSFGFFKLYQLLIRYSIIHERLVGRCGILHKKQNQLINEIYDAKCLGKELSEQVYIMRKSDQLKDVLIGKLYLFSCQMLAEIRTRLHIFQSELEKKGNIILTYQQKKYYLQEILVRLTQLEDFTTCSAHKEMVNVPDLIEECCAIQAKIACQKEVVLNYEISGDIPPIYADRLRLLQIVNSLCARSLDFLPKGKRVDMFCYSCFHQGDRYLDITVKDNGLGVDEEMRETMFGRMAYHAILRYIDGVSLPAAAIKKLVSLHGGELHIYDIPESGSVVKVKIPYPDTNRIKEKNFYSAYNNVVPLLQKEEI